MMIELILVRLSVTALIIPFALFDEATEAFSKVQ
jgi:hypothetical protein